MVSNEELQGALSSLRNELARDYQTRLENQATNLSNLFKQELDNRLAAASAGHRRDRESVTMKRAFQSLPRYGGKAEDYDDWKFKVKTFLSEEDGYAEIIIELELLGTAPTVSHMTNFFDKLREKFPEVDMARCNKQLYQLLSLNLTDKALAQVKNLYDQVDTNGFVAWWKLGFECNAMTAQRMQGLANKVLAPRRCKKYGEVVQALEEWEYSLKLYERTEGQMSDRTRVFALRRIVPEELEQVIIQQSNTLGNYEQVKAYVIEQTAVRRDLKSTMSSGPVPMEVDTLTRNILAHLGGDSALDYGSGSGQEEGHCAEDNENDENPDETDEEKVFKKVFSMVKGAMKGKGKGGKGKGRFEGNCSHCGMYGHKMNQCWKKDEEMNAWRKGQHLPHHPGHHQGAHQDGKGKGKSWGKGQGKGYVQPWQHKGKGKGSYGLNLWDLNYNYGGEHHCGDQSQGAQKGPWTLSLTSTSPPGLTNKWEILQKDDINEDESELNEVNELDEDEYPWSMQGSKSKHKKMPQMGNYSKNKMRKHLNIFVSAPKNKTLNPAVGQHEAQNGWIRIKGVMDSGASESVAPPGLCPLYPVVPSAGSMAGQEYMSASNDLIPNLGEQVLDVVLDGGQESQIKYQIAEVSRPLNSISEICDAGGDHGQMVIFGRSGGAVVNLRTGEQTPFKREEGIYCLDVWVKPKAAGFQRQGW